MPTSVLDSTTVSTSPVPEATPGEVKVKTEKSTSPALPPTADESTSIFCFDGEFTKISVDFDVDAKKPAVDEMVTRIRDEAQQAASLLYGYVDV